MNNDSLYILRYPLVPEEPKQRRIDLLLQFCEQAKIDEVMFFVMPEEYNRGQWRLNDYEPWLEIAVTAKERLEKQGLVTSLNLWHTLLHSDRGRRSEDLRYRRMVTDMGYQCQSVACPLCPDWQTLFFDTFQRWARAGFKAIWLEDDFRLHNHSGHGWGGCFCDVHMARLHQCGTRARTREELIVNLNAPGGVHPDRTIWLDLNGQTWIDLARTMRAKMDEVDPAIKLGLMTSSLIHHAQEGRNWRDLIGAMGGPDRTMVRPHAIAYQEHCQRTFFDTFGNLSQTLNVLPKGVKTFFEIENSPMSRYSRSNHQTRMQMASVLDGGCAGVTLDVLDFLGTGPASEPAMAATLAASKDQLLTIRRWTAETRPVGIEAILTTRTPYAAPGTGSIEVADIPTIQYGWYAFLTGFGYPCFNRPALDAAEPEQPYALAGASVWALPEPLLRAMLQTGLVLLDATAAAIIRDRGLGECIGITGLHRCENDECPFSYEEDADLRPEAIPQRAGINQLHDAKLHNFVHLYALTATGRPRTVIKDCFGRPLGIGSFTYANATGGRGLVLPYALPSETLLHNWTRKAWMDRWLDELDGRVAVPYLTDGAWVYLSARTGPSHRTLFLANHTFEVYDRLQIRLPTAWATLDWATALHSRSKPVKATVTKDTLILRTPLVGNDWLMLVGR